MSRADRIGLRIALVLIAFLTIMHVAAFTGAYRG